MVGFLKPILIVVAIVMVGAAIATSCRTVTGSPDEWQLLHYRCNACRYHQALDADLLIWTCQRCGARHWQGEGKLPP